MSRYAVETFSSHGYTAYRLRDTARRAEAVLYPALGNNCTEFRTTPGPDGKDSAGADSAPVDVFLPPATPDELTTGSPFHSGQPILFPFPNRVRNGEFTFEGRAVHMEGLLKKGWDRGAGQAIHGLVADKAWTVEKAEGEADGAVVRAFLQLDAFADIAEQYPYPCRLTVTYRLREGVLEMHIEVANTGDHTLPMGFGIHPWFPVSLQPGKKMPEAFGEITSEQRERAQVHVPAAGLWELEKLMPTGTILSLDDLPEYDLRAFRPLDGLALDHVFTRVQHRADGWSEGGLRDPETGVEMFLAASEPFREWVLYAPTTRHVIALEPYTCVTDAVNLEPKGIDAGLIALPAGQTWNGEIHFGLRRTKG